MPHDNTFDALIADQRQGAREAHLGADLDETAVFVLPLVLTLARLAARRHAVELATA